MTTYVCESGDCQAEGTEEMPAGERYCKEHALDPLPRKVVVTIPTWTDHEIVIPDKCAECGVLVDEYDAAKTVCRIADCHICDARCNVPPDYEVQPLGPDDAAERRTTCGACGLSWDDAKVTSMTPTPSGRCPFEAFHNPEAT